MVAITKKFWAGSLALALAILVQGCGGGGGGGGTNAGGNNPTATTNYAVGGSVTGLTGTLVLQNNAGDNLSLTANGAFAFATQLASNRIYSVSVQTQPAGEVCSIANGSGTVSSSNVSTITVTCSTSAYTVTRSVAALPVSLAR